MEINNEIPRKDYPRPQMKRDTWVNLNGIWEFEFDHGNSKKERELFKKEEFETKINVPFCPESKLSGIEYKDFMSSVWYKRDFEVKSKWLDKKLLIHFGAVDYEAEVWINEQLVGIHKGGYSSFAFDISKYVELGKNTIVVNAKDDVRSKKQPKGKQADKYYSSGCDYTRTTGIWQTVWIEIVPLEYIKDVKYIPDPDNKCVYVEAQIESENEYELKAQVLFNGEKVATNITNTSSDIAYMKIELDKIYLWKIGEGNLYDIELKLKTNEGCTDSISGYFGLRSVKIKDKKILLNNEPIFQRLVLDQGFYPDGIYTAPSDEDLKKDIEISMAMGFNGARMHQKVFEKRYIYWADKLGYLLWGEHGSWGLDITTPKGLENFLPEWLEILKRDISAPSIIGWCPFNETWDIKGKDAQSGVRQDDEVLRITYNVTKAIDKTRPVIDTSGNYHVVTDVFDIHDYEQDPQKFADKFKNVKENEMYTTFQDRQKYEGQPYFVSEYGGIWWNPNKLGLDGWGYGDRPKSEDEFLRRYEKLTTCLLDDPRICAFCYTQLYDVEQEVNGLYTYQRKAKFKPEIIKKINSKKAAIEE